MDLLTTSQIAKQLKTDRDKVSYALRRTVIAPIEIVRHTRVYVELFLNRNQFFEEVTIKRVERLEQSNV